MKIIIAGGDGFVGWPVALHLSNLGHEVVIIDNLARRSIDEELNIQSLTPISNIYKRIDTWNKNSPNKIEFIQLDIALGYNELKNLIHYVKPDTILHFAEQRSAPYSMLSPEHKRYTVNNNITATHNLLNIITTQNVTTHLVHIGSTGVYGYGTPGKPIDEGYTRLDGKRVPYPTNPGSIYHMTKTMDLEMFHYYAKNDKLRITDLEQGIIWGTNTDETLLHKDLINRFDYDGEFGTVLNRFLMQAAINYPLTVYGTGGQTRAFIHIRDSVKCVQLAVENPPESGDKVKIFNQVTECHNLKNLAKKISGLTGAEIRYYKNPRNEDPENELSFVTDNFRNLGLDPITLTDGLLVEIMDVAKKYKHRCSPEKIITVAMWDKNKEVDTIGKSHE